MEKIALKIKLKSLEEMKRCFNKFYEAAKSQKANSVLRICADNPFIDPEQIDIL